MPFGGLLISVGELQDDRFAAGRAADLEADGQTRAREAARDGDGREAIGVERGAIAKVQPPLNRQRIISGGLQDRARRDGSGWRD